MIKDDVESVFGVCERLQLTPNTSVSTETFARIFAAAPSEPTHEDLCSIDGGNLGYIPFFDRCKAEGILS